MAMTDSIFEYAGELFPELNSVVIDSLVWEHTSYPLSSLEVCKQQLDIFKESIDNPTTN